MDLIRDFLHAIGYTARDILPVAFFMVFFYVIVLRQQLAQPRALVVGFLFMLGGLTMFLLGLEQALFPVGKMMVQQLAAASAGGPEAQSLMGGYGLVVAFAFCLAFGAAVAEPALLAIAVKVGDISGGAISPWGLRLAAALGVAAGVTIGCMRIVTGMPLHWCLAAGYLIIIVQTAFAPRVIVPLAYDSGGVSTTAVTVPVVTAIGLGLAEHVPGRSPLLDGFGLIALACIYPVISVLAYAQIASLSQRRQSRRRKGRKAN